jgi:hypothetical protein
MAPSRPDNLAQKIISNWQFWLLLLLVLTTILAWPGMSSPPLLDDKDGIAHSMRFESWQETFGPDSFGLFRPLKNFIFYFFGKQSEINLPLWHGMVLLAFLASIVSVFAMARSVLTSAPWALVAAAVWALTPTQTIAAVWMSCINISISVIFLSVFLIMHRRSMNGGKFLSGSALIAALLLFLGQVSYETAVAGVALAFIADQFIGNHSSIKTRSAHYALYIATTLLFLTIRHFNGSTADNQASNLGFAPDTQLWQLFVSAPWFICKHIQMWFFPLGRIEFVSTYIWGKSATPLELASAWIILIGIVVGAWLLRKKLPVVTFGVFWFLLAAAPSSNLIPIFAGPIEDYYLIIPSIGFGLVFASLLRELCLKHGKSFGARSERVRLLTVTSIGVLCVWRLFLIPFFHLQAELWNKPLELYIRCANTRPLQFQAQGLAARELYVLGDFDQAYQLAKGAAETAPWYPVSHMVQGFAANSLGKPEEALDSLNKVLGISDIESRLKFACRLEIADIHLRHTRQFDLARETILPILESSSAEYRLDAVHLLTEIYIAKNNVPKAIQTLQQGLSLFPDDPTLIEHLQSIQQSPVRAIDTH